MPEIELKDAIATQVEVVNRGPVATQIVNAPLQVRVTGFRISWGEVFTLVFQVFVCSIPAMFLIWFIGAMLFGSLIAGLASR